MNHIKSLREYIDALKEIGEIQEIDKEVDWNLEMGAITRHCYELRAPAPLFNSIRGIEKGFRVLGAPAGVSRQHELYLSRCSISLGFPARANGQGLIEALAKARAASPIPPRIVESGPCKENILLGDDVDLLRLPSPYIHDGDGGRYLGTYGTIVAQTPDGRWTNWSISRVMLLDKRKMTGVVNILQHVGMIHNMWKELGKPMPFALALGVEPVIPFVSSMELPAYLNEADYIGGYLGEPIDVVLCETVDLYVPATSEIVIEGFLSHEETAMEGPMGEYAGYMGTGPGRLQPVYNVTAMTFRNHPILPLVAAGEPVEEDHTVHGITGSAEMLWLLRKEGLPVTMVWTPFETAEHWLVVTVPATWRKTMKCRNHDFVQKIGRIVFSSKFGMMIPRVLVMNDDINPTNTLEVAWAFATRCHPGTGEIGFDKEVTVALVAFLKSGEKKANRTAKTVYNCLPQEEFGETMPTRSSFKYAYPKELQDKILSNWTAYGFK
jgi:UbiD family decarboxylase